jgi:hypothetical protein
LFRFWEPHRRTPRHFINLAQQKRLPQVAAQRRAAQHRWRERQRARKGTTLAAERGDAAGDDVAA